MGRYPFPHNQRVHHCVYPDAADVADVERAHRAWIDEIVTSEGAGGFLRTRRPDTPDGVPNSTVSEGIAYAMIISVMRDDQGRFDAFFRYADLWSNAHGLMDWYIAPDGSKRLGLGGATDADEDIAWALVMADRQWGGRGSLDEDYLSLAKRQIERIWQFEVDHERWPDMLLPGDDWRGQNVFNPSYFAPNQYRVFAQVTGEAGWLRVIDRGYQIIDASLSAAHGNETNGLVPAWCTAEGVPVEAFPGAMTNYQYDSARLPFRIAQDWAESQDPRAKHYLGKVIGFFSGIGASNVVDGYALDGTPAPDPKSVRPNSGSAVFVGSIAAGAMFDPRHQALVDEGYARVATGELLARSRYYNHCWTVLSLLMLTGNLVTFEP